MRDHALNFAHIFGGRNQARMDVDNLPTGDKGVNLFIVDQNNLDMARLQPGRADDIHRHIGKERFRLGIAQYGLRIGVLKAEEQRKEKGKQPCGEGGVSHDPAFPPTSLNES